MSEFASSLYGTKGGGGAPSVSLDREFDDRTSGELFYLQRDFMASL